MWDIPDLTINDKIIIKAPLVFQKKLYCRKKVRGFIKIMPIIHAVPEMEAQVRVCSVRLVVGNANSGYK